jgi:hypothetical protein
LGRQLDYVEIGCRPLQAVHLSHHEAADAVQPDRCIDCFIQITEERMPRFRRLFRCRYG